MVFEIYSDSPGASASKGIRVGASRDEILASYGDDCEDTGYQLIYSLSAPRGAARTESLCFDLLDGIVTGISLVSEA